MKRIRYVLWIAAGPLAVLLAMLAAAHPHLAITERSGSDILVVEGWMEQPHLLETAHWADSLGYQRIYTTGSVRPFAYYLKVDDAIEIRFGQVVTGDLRLNVSGLTGAGFRVTAGTDTLMERYVVNEATDFDAERPVSTDHLRITSLHSGSTDRTDANIFIQYCTLGGENVHLLQVATWFIHTDGTRANAWPTYAHSSAARLAEAGLAPQRITAVPSWGRPDSRSWANASYFAVQADADDIQAFDVITVGVHARRSRELFRRACGPGTTVGVISLEDPHCPAHGWWRMRSGWVQMLKEIAGSSEPIAVDLTH